MAEDWAATAADVAAALAEVGFAVTLEEPGAEMGPASDPILAAPVLHSVKAIDRAIRVRDAGGLVVRTVRTLTIAADVAPAKGWRVQVRGTWCRVAEVKPLAPGGTDLLFRLELEA